MKNLVDVAIIHTDRSERQSTPARLCLRGQMVRPEYAEAAGAHPPAGPR